MDNQLERPNAVTVLDDYHRFVKGIVEASKKIFERFVWRPWPSQDDPGRPKPSLFSCFHAVDDVVWNCGKRGNTLDTEFESARLLLRRSASVSSFEWAGINRVTAHEIAEEFGQVIKRLVNVTQPPFDMNEKDEIDRDHERMVPADCGNRMYSKDSTGWDDPDLFPALTMRVGPEWFAFQTRFATEIARQLSSLHGRDLDDLRSRIEWELAIVKCATDKEVAELLPDGNGDSNKSRKPGVKGKRIHEQMVKKLQDDPTCIDWSVADWVRFLHCSKSTIQTTKAWQSILTTRAIIEAEKATQRKSSKPTDRRRFRKKPLQDD